MRSIDRALHRASWGVGPRGCAALLAVFVVGGCGDGSGVPITGRDAQVASVGLSPTVGLLTTLGDQIQLSAVARDAASNIVTGVSFTWTSDADSVLSVDPATGLATALAAGNDTTPVVVTATTAGLSGQATVWVLPPAYGALDVNLAKEMVGFVREYELDASDVLTSTSRALLWTSMTVVQELASLGGEGSVAMAINGNREIAGTGHLPNGDERAFFHAVGGITDLGALDGSSSEAFDLNDVREVVGIVRGPGSDRRVVVWDVGGSDGAIDDLAGDEFEPAAISSRRAIAGTRRRADGSVTAFLWEGNNNLFELDTVEAGPSHGADVNRSAELVGTIYADTLLTSPRGFFWSRQSGVVRIETTGGDPTTAVAVNRWGDVAGTATLAAGPRAFSWSRQSGIDLVPTLGGCCAWAHGINDSGDVVGVSTTATGELRGFLWRPGIGISELAILPPR